MQSRFVLAVQAVLWLNSGMTPARCFALFLFAAAFFRIPTASAQFGLEASTAPQVHASASASVETYSSGASFSIAAAADIPAPWHAYYTNPGTVGLPMTAELTAPEGFEVLSVRWSAPVREESSIGVSYAYRNPVIVWEVKAAGAVPETAEFKINLSWQLCREGQCLPPEERALSLPLKRGSGEPADGWAKTLEAVEPLRLIGEASARESGNTVTLIFRLPEGEGALEGKSVNFFSSDNVILPSAPQLLRQEGNGAWALAMERNSGGDAMYPVEEALAHAPLKRLEGLLTVDGKGCALDVLVEPAAPAEGGTPTAGGGEPSFLYILGMLFLGGVVLNLMPCVFPVIGLKILGFVRLGGGERRKVLAHSAAFVLGILISFWALTGLLIYLSSLAPGVTRSWAEWMQAPWVVYALMLLMLVMGMCMCGVFEIGVRAAGAGAALQKSGENLAGSFFAGLLATVVATPCSAPFLGPVMAFALQLPPVRLFAAMTSMALGLASPYFVMGAFPGLVRFLPKPGAWMESLRQALGFLLFAAAAWLLSVYLSLVPEEQSFDVPRMLMAMVVFASAWWVYGRWCPVSRARGARIGGLCAAVLLASLGVLGSMPRGAEPAGAADEVRSSDLVWEPWSEEALENALDEGRPVYVDFTAKWCMTCLSNKMIAYSDEVAALLKEKNVLLLRADKTRPNPAIDAAMRKLNRSSIPVNALYVPGGEPAVTTELLTPGYLYDFLEKRLADY